MESLATRISAHFSWSIALLLAILHWGLAVWASRANSTTFDEVAHIGGGMGNVLFGDYRLNPENGVLPQMIAAYAMVSGGTKFPDVSDPSSHEGMSWSHSDGWELGYRTLYQVCQVSISLKFCSLSDDCCFLRKGMTPNTSFSLGVGRPPCPECLQCFWCMLWRGRFMVARPSEA